MRSVLPLPPRADVILQRDDPDSPLTVQQLIAPFFLGIVVNYFLWGVQITQSYYYYKTYRESDRLWMKTSVALLFIADLVESICASQAAWRFMVEGWGQLDAVSVSPGWGLYSIPITDGFIASIVHFFYAQKIWMLLQPPYNYIGTITVISFSCLQFTGAAGCSVFMYLTQMTFAEFDRIKSWAIIWLVTASVTDIVITSLMSWKLSNSRTGYKRTDDIISRVIRLTVETGMATAVVQIVEIISYLHWLHKPFHIVLGVMIPKVYSNSMLALLNSRQAYKNGLQERSQNFSSSNHYTSNIGDIRINTTQTVAVAGDYELDAKANAGIKSPALRGVDRRAVEDLDYSAHMHPLPFTQKGSIYPRV